MYALRLLCAGLAFCLGSGVLWGQATNPTNGPSGFFQGTATSPRSGKISLTLNLTCDNGHVAGLLTTSAGSFTVKDSKADAGHMHLTLDAGSDKVALDAVCDAGRWHGTYAAADDSGTVEFRRTGDARIAATAENSRLSPRQWHQDVAFLGHELPLRHANAFHYITRHEFDSEVAALDHDINHLDSDQTYVRMNQIAVSVGDAHTYVNIPADDAGLPIYLERFGDEYRVVGTADAYKQALGARVLRIQDTSIAKARRLLLALTPPEETDVLREARVTSFLRIGIFLHGVGITSDRTAARYTLKSDDGRIFAIRVNAAASELAAKSHVSEIYGKRPLFRQRPGDTFWSVYLSDSRTVYCSFRGYEDLSDKSKDLFNLIRQCHPNKLVIDLRLNGGGDYEEGLKYLVDPIRNLPDINRKGHLFVLIGPKTFSAAMSNSAHFRYRTRAILVGQQIGEKPNSYQEVREVQLPNSHWTVRYSVKYYKFVPHGRNAVIPDHEVILIWDEYKLGEDPALAWILNRK